MIGSTAPDESDEVLAFIAARRGPVMEDAIRVLADAPVSDLRPVTHRLHGILGSYGLDAAHELIVDLSDTLADPSTDDRTADDARVRTVSALRALTDGVSR